MNEVGDDGAAVMVGGADGAHPRQVNAEDFNVCALSVPEHFPFSFVLISLSPLKAFPCRLSCFMLLCVVFYAPCLAAFEGVDNRVSRISFAVASKKVTLKMDACGIRMDFTW